jgi:predicted nucleotidyltransferase
MHSETFGERIRRLRQAQNMSLRELTAALNYDQSSLSKIERNELPAPESLVEPMAKKLGVRYKDLAVKYLSERVYYLLKESDFALEVIEIAGKRLEKEGKGTVLAMKRARLLEQIREYLARQPIDKAWVFGSFAREDESYDSDLDLLVRFVKPNKLDLLDYVGIKQDLEELSGRQVDLVEEGYLLPNAKDAIEKEKVLIYERKAG